MNIFRHNFRNLGLLVSPLRINVESSRLRYGVDAAVDPKETAAVETVADDQLGQSRLDKLFKRIELEVRGNDPAVIKSYCKFSTLAASHLGIEVLKSWALRKSTKERHTLLKSVHVHKKHRVQYEIRTYYHFIHLARLTESTSDTFLEYLERNLPEGVAMKVTKVEIQPLPEYLKPPSNQES